MNSEKTIASMAEENRRLREVILALEEKLLLQEYVLNGQQDGSNEKNLDSAENHIDHESNISNAEAWEKLRDDNKWMLDISNVLESIAIRQRDFFVKLQKQDQEHSKKDDESENCEHENCEHEKSVDCQE